MCWLVALSRVFVRGLFGHSFSTWRLYLRGETVCSAQDVGWLRNLTVSSIMRTDVATVCIHATVAECRKQFLLGSRQALFVTDEQNAYHGAVLLPDVFSGDLEGAGEQIEIGALVRYPDIVLVGSMNVTSAMRGFEQAGADVLAVVDHKKSGLIVGFLSEAYARRRYIEELNRATGRAGQI
jgi:CIC family chloride channel protein